MGQCYSVTLRICVRDEKGLIEAMKKQIEKGENEKPGTRYNLLEHAIDCNVYPYSLDAYIVSTFVGWQHDYYEKVFRKGYAVYYSDFSCCYGWERVMIEMFEVMAPYLTDRSSLTIYPDNDYDKLIVKNGVAIQTH